MIFMAMFLQMLRAVPGLLAWSSEAAGRRPWLARSFRKPQDSKARSLSQYQGKMILVVNAASFCGTAGQRGGLAFVHDTYTIHRDGIRVDSYRSLIAPDSRSFDGRSERWLAEKP